MWVSREEAAAQRAYDAATPTEDRCGQGHAWVLVGEAPDGAQFYRCRRCGIESE